VRLASFTRGRFAHRVRFGKLATCSSLAYDEYAPLLAPRDPGASAPALLPDTRTSVWL
jgi:hypothetical protein